MEVQWNYDEFLAYLLIYASYADLEFSQQEKMIILQTVNEETFKELEQTYLSATDYERLKLILDHKGLYYPTLDQKKELLFKIKKLFEADGEFSRLEKSLSLFLEKLL